MVLIVLAIRFPTLRYPVPPALIFPVRYSVEPAIEEVCITFVLSVFAIFTVFAVILERERVPPGFVMTAELSRKDDTCVASIELYTVRLLVVIAFEAVMFCVLIPGTVIGSEKRRS